MICHDYKCIFVHVPKTAGMSIEHYFLNLVGLTVDTREPLLLRYNDNPKKGPERLAHLYATEYVDLGYVRSSDFKRYFKFSFVRNPWSRLVSEYRYRKHYLDFTFKDFVKNEFPAPSMKDEYRHVVPQYDYIHDKNGHLLVDFVGRYERLNEDFTEVCAHLNLHDSGLPYVNSSNKKLKLGVRTGIKYLRSKLRQSNYSDYRSYYDEETKQIVTELYRKDIEAFGYTF